MLSTLSRQRGRLSSVVTVSQMTHIDDLISRSAQAVIDSRVFNISRSLQRNCPLNALYAQSTDVAKRGQIGNRHLATQTRILNGEEGQGVTMLAIYFLTQTDDGHDTGHIKIHCAAHAILACTVFLDMAQHTQKAQLEILGKCSKK